MCYLGDFLKAAGATTLMASPEGSNAAAAGGQRQSNLQRIQQRKQAVRGWPIDKKLEKLAIYSSCKIGDECKCNGWKNPNPAPNPPTPDAPAPSASPQVSTAVSRTHKLVFKYCNMYNTLRFFL